MKITLHHNQDIDSTLTSKKWLQIEYLSKISLSCLLHLNKDHRRYLFWEKHLLFTFVLDLQFGFPTIINNLKRPGFHVCLHCLVSKLSTNQSFCVCNINDDIINSIWDEDIILLEATQKLSVGAELNTLEISG